MQLKWLLLIILLVSSLILSSVLVSRITFGIGNIANVVSSAGIAILILRCRMHLNILLIWFLLVSGYYFLLIYQGTIVDFAHASENSRNSVSVHMLFVTVTLYILYYLNRENLPWWPAFILFIICLWAIGRGGIITSAILFFAVLLERFRNLSNKLSLVAMLFLTAFLFTIFGDKVSVFIYDFIKIEQTINDVSSRTEIMSSRNYIIYDFFETSSLIDLIIGQDLHKGVMWREWGGNTHNSFLSLVAYTGLIGFAIFIYWIYVNIRLFSFNFILGTLMLVVFIRLFSEYVVWFSVFDYLPFLFVFFNMDFKTEKYKSLKVIQK